MRTSHVRATPPSRRANAFAAVLGSLVAITVAVSGCGDC